MIFNALLGKIIKRGSLTVVAPNGQPRHFGDGSGLPVTVRIHDRTAAYEIGLNPYLKLGEAYMDGRLTIETANVELDAGTAAQAGDVAPGHYVMIAVSDTGVGMSPEVIARAFDPFFTTKEVGKGSGLGLSMVYGFVKQSQGHVQVSSAVGLGTTVRIYLPRASAAAERPAAAPEPEDLPGGSERILLVEDDDLVRSHVSAQLVQFGYRVVSARNGPEALRLLQEDGGFDLLFTDIVMPGGMNGLQLAEAARRLRPDLPVLFTSGYTDEAMQPHEPPAHGARLITKPYRRQELARRLRETLALRPTPAG